MKRRTNKLTERMTVNLTMLTIFTSSEANHPRLSLFTTSKYDKIHTVEIPL